MNQLIRKNAVTLAILSKKRVAMLLVVAVISAGTWIGCNSTLFLNPAFVNSATGEVFPLTPGDRAAFVLVRGNNTTQSAIEFVVTAERLVPDDDDPDVLNPVLETFRLLTQPTAQANDLGVLLDCPVARVGLGENLDRPQTEPGLFVGATAVGAGGFGVPPNINPLSADFGNFDCGDTIVFQASTAGGAVGGVIVASFVLDDAGQPDVPSGIDTFVNARSLLEEQELDDDDVGG